MTDKSFEENYKTWHTYLSIVKSMIRIATSLCIFIGYLSSYPFDHSNPINAIVILAIGYGIAEVIGILEEL